jgi:hypothetical protein
MGESDLAGDSERFSGRGTNVQHHKAKPIGAGHRGRQLPMREHCVIAPITHLRDERLSYSFG